jgi:hypothetical protein
MGEKLFLFKMLVVLAILPGTAPCEAVLDKKLVT